MTSPPSKIAIRGASGSSFMSWAWELARRSGGELYATTVNENIH